MAAEKPNKLEDSSILQQSAMRLVKSMIFAKVKGDLKRRNSLLEELRQLRNDYPRNSVLHEWLATGIYNTLNDTIYERDPKKGNALLEELRQLYQNCPENADVREKFAKGIFVMQADARENKNLKRWDELFKEQCRLHQDYPHDSVVSKQFAGEIINWLLDVRDENDLLRFDELLLELRKAQREHAADVNIQRVLAINFVKTMDHPENRNNIVLEKLRRLQKVWSDDIEMREYLTEGIFKMMKYAIEENDLKTRESLIVELCRFHREWPHNQKENSRELIQGITTNFDISEDKKLDVNLEILRKLQQALPQLVFIGQQIALGLFKQLTVAEDKGDLTQRDTVLKELHRLQQTWPNDAIIRQQLAFGLFNAMYDSKVNGDMKGQDSFLQELRRLQQTFPDDEIVRDQLALGLFNAMYGMKDALIKELQMLHQAFPDDANVREWLVKGLFNSLKDARFKNDAKKINDLTKNLRRLYQSWPRDDFWKPMTRKTIWKDIK